MVLPTGTRSRSSFTTSRGVKRTYSGGVLVDTATFDHFGRIYQVTSSKGNPVSLIGKGGDIGGNFGTQFLQTTAGDTSVNVSTPFTGGATYAYEGPISPWSGDLSGGGFGNFLPFSSQSQMNVYGTQAIARCIPTNPLSGMGQFLGELRDLPRGIDVKSWHSKIRNFRQEAKRYNLDRLSRDAADEALNGMFGWAPFISDLLKFADVVRNSSVRMQQYAKGSNHLIRRRYRFPTDHNTTTSVTGPAWYPALPSPLVVNMGKTAITTTSTTERWFSGAFTYYLPPIIPEDNEFVQAINKWKIAEAYANRLFGLRLTPDLLYKLTPWSWALDWVSTTGDVVHNWSAFANDGLVLHHGYIMERLFDDTSYALVDCVLVNGPISSTQTRRRESKSRWRATPYGFGVNPSSFTGKQWAVIAALGISKQPLSLNF